MVRLEDQLRPVANQPNNNLAELIDGGLNGVTKIHRASDISTMVIIPFITIAKSRSYAAASIRLGGKPPLALLGVRYCRTKATAWHNPASP
jgi:hypothetical protein